MTKRQLEKVRERFEDLDLSRYRILTYDEMLKVNGGSGSDSDDDDDELEDNFENEEPADGGNTASVGSTNEAGDAAEENGKDAEEEPEEDYHVTSHAEVANAEVGDTATRSDGTEVTLTEADIEYEQNYCDAHGIDWSRGDEEEAASANAGVPSEEPAEDLPEEETDDGGSSDSDTPAQEQESVASSESGAGRTDDTDSTATDSVKADCDEEKADSAGKNSENAADNEAKNSGENKSDTAEPETKDNEKQAEEHAENTAKSGSDASNKENSSSPQENSHTSDAAPPSASQTSQTAAAPSTGKEEHGFWDSVIDLFNDAKDWVCDVFGFGDGKKDSENIVVEQPVSPAEKVKAAITDVGEKQYEKGKYRCDEYVNEVVRKAGYNPADYYVDNPSGKTVTEHINDLKNSGSNYSMQVPTSEGVYVVFMDGKGSLGTLEPHCGILEVSATKEMSFIHNSSANSNIGVDTWSVSAQNDGTKLSGLAYSDFYFQEIK